MLFNEQKIISRYCPFNRMCMNRTVVSLDVMGDGRASLDLDLEDGLHPHEEEGEDEVVDNAIPRREGTHPQLYRSCIAAVSVH